MSKKGKANINSAAALSGLITDKIIGGYPENNGYHRDFVEFVTKILINAIGFSIVFCFAFFFLKFEEGVVISLIMIVMLAASTIFYKTKIGNKDHCRYSNDKKRVPNSSITSMRAK